MARPQVSIRLATSGKAEVQRDFTDIATSGDAAARRIASAFERDAASAEAALSKLAKTQERLAAVSATPLQQQINRTTGVGTATDGNARASAAALAQQLDQAEREARQLLSAIDPLFAAQTRYTAQVERINAVKATGQLTEAQFQQLMAREKVILDEATAAALRHGGASGQMRMGMQQLSFQVGDVSTQMAMGTKASVIFAQQSGQVIQALQLMGGQGNAFLRFLGGPWGIALSAAAVALTPVIGKLLESGETVDDLVEKLKKEAAQQRLNDQAHAAFAFTLDGVTEALKKNRDALKGLSDQGKTAAEQALAQAKGQLTVAEINRFATQSTINYTRSLIELNRERAKVAGNDPRLTMSLNADSDASAARLNSLQQELGNWDAAIAEAKRQVSEAESQIAVSRGQESAGERIKRQYADRIEQTRQRLLNEHATTAEIERQTRALANQRDAAVKAAEDKGKKPGVNAGGTAIFNDQIASFFDIAARYRGMSETGNRTTLQAFLGNVDPEKTAWCAAFVNAVLAAGGATGTGSLAARSFLNYGKDDTKSPQRGDIVIVRSEGSPSGTHVGFLDSIDSRGNVKVLGGNTGNKVGTATYRPSDVLGVRRPPTPSEIFSDEQDAADQMSRRLADQMSKEQEVSLVKEHQLDLADQILRKQGATLESVDAILPSLRAWEREYDRIIASQEEAKSFIGSQLDDIFNIDRWKDWGDLGMSVLRSLEQELVKLALLNPLKNWLLGENNPTAGSVFGTIFKGLGAIFGGGGGFGGDAFVSLSSSAASSASSSLSNFDFGSLPGFAAGTDYSPGGLAWVGEHGRELVRLPRGSKVSTAAESRRIAAANDGGIGAISIPITIDATGADSAELARTRAELAQLKQDLPGLIVGHYSEARSRNMIR